MKIIILAGGKGTRLWPLSNSSCPKQFLSFGQEETLFQKTLRRSLSLCAPKDIFIVTQKEYLLWTQKQLCNFVEIEEENILIEPEAKSTAPAIALAMKTFQEKGIKEDETILVTSSDHLISPQENFAAAVEKGRAFAKKGFLVTLGVRPHKPETGYGYIKTAPTEDKEVYTIEKFIEKPSRSKAEDFLLEGNYLWNVGIFLFTMKTFWEEVKKHFAALFEVCCENTDYLLQNFSKIPPLSIDHALMEKTTLGITVIADIMWSDVGCWESVYDILEKDHEQNVKVGNVFSLKSKDSLFYSQKKLIAAVGLEDIVVVETEETIFVMKKEYSQEVKNLVFLLENSI